MTLVLLRHSRECRVALHQKRGAISNFSTLLKLFINSLTKYKAAKRNTVMKRRQKLSLFAFDMMVYSKIPGIVTEKCIFLNNKVYDEI